MKWAITRAEVGDDPRALLPKTRKQSGINDRRFSAARRPHNDGDKGLPLHGLDQPAGKFFSPEEKWRILFAEGK